MARIDMGGTHVGCGVVAGDRLSAHASIKAEGTSNLADLLPVLGDALRSLLRETGTTAKQCQGITIGFPGIVDARDGKIHSTLKKYDDAPKLDLKAWARKTFDLPLRIENDARMALMGEQFAGAGRGVKNIVMMTLGTGIGSATILDGRILRGVHGHAGCLGGHLTAKFDGRTCHCGNLGCAEAEASGWSMPLVARAWPGFTESALAGIESLGFRELFTHAERGDAVASEVRERCMRVWVANAVWRSMRTIPRYRFWEEERCRAQSLSSLVCAGVRQRSHLVKLGEDKGSTSSGTLENTAALLGSVPLLSEEMHGTSSELR